MKVNLSFFRKIISPGSILFITLHILMPSNVCGMELIVATIDHRKIDAELENLPVLLKLDETRARDFFDRIVSNPDNSLKFRVYDSTGSPCYVEKELWNYPNRLVILHVKVSLVSSTEDTVLTLIYDETMADNESLVGDVGSPAAQNVWDSDFTHVLHLSESGDGTQAEYKESTAYGNDGTGVRPPDRVDGKISHGQSFGSTSDGEYIQVDGPDPDGRTGVTFEALFKPDAGALSGQRHIIQNPGTGNYTSIVLRHGAYLEFLMYIGGGAKAMGTTPLVGGTWYYGAGRWKSGEPVIAWLNDAQDGASADTSGKIGRGIADRYEIGNWHSVTKREFANGVVDEIRISRIKRSDAWLKATYHSLFDTLITYRTGPDSDRDRLADGDETDIYGTDPYDADTDDDGMEDGTELGYWHADWRADTDNDGSINLLDPDSDNDGVLDGEEVDQSFDPADQNAYPPQILSTISTTIDHNKIDADLFDFPVMLKLDETNAQDFFERIVSNPANALKFRVEDSTGSRCYVEKELWDYDNRAVSLHVKVPFVNSTEDTVLNLFYDETMVDNNTHVGEVGSRPAQSVWDNYFTHVLHLSENGNGTDNEYRDSTARGNHGTGAIAPDRVQAQIGYGQSFGLKSDGEYIQVDGPDPNGNTEITLEALFKPDSGSLNNYRHIIQNPGKGQNASLVLRHGKFLETWMYIGGGSSAKGTTPLVGGTWYYAAGRWKSGEPVSAWLNDTQEAVSAEKSGTIGRGRLDLYEIGNWHSISGREFENGAADEIRISSIKRSDAWLKATYHSLFNTLVEYEFGPDSDGDGILDNDEVDIYGTDRNNADTDGDGINDGDELAYWGDDWDADADNDGIVNLLDPDSDNDGLPDGEEIEQGFDPADPGNYPLPSAGYRDVDYGLAGDEQQGGGGLISETVRILNGNMVEYRTDINFSSPHRRGLAFQAFYNSRSNTLGDLGYGWTHSYEAYLNTRIRISGHTYLGVVDETRRAHFFLVDSPGIYTGAFTEKSSVKIENSTFVWYRLDGSRYAFSSRGRLIWIDDAIGNRLNVKYDDRGHLDTVKDNAGGRMLRFHYFDGLLDYIEGPATDAVPDGKWVEYEYDANGNLISVCYADGSGFDYVYNGAHQIHNLTGKKNKLGHQLNTWTYDQYDRCTGCTNRQGQGVRISYRLPDSVEVIDDYGALRTYTIAEINGRRRVTSMLGAANPPYSDNYAVSWTYDSDLNLTEVQYANGTVDQYQDYDTKGNPGTVILAAGETEERTITWTYHPDMKVPLTRTESGVLGAGNKVTIWDYDDDYDVTPNENPANLIARVVEQGFTKNASGQTVPYEYVTTFIYNDQGRILTFDGPRTDVSDVTSFRYDSISGNLNTISRPLIGETSLPESDYDAAGQPGKIIDVNGQSTRFVYDGKGRIITVIHNADGSYQTASYNDAGFADTIVDEDGVEKGYEYDETYGRLYRRYDPENNYIQYLYDNQGNLIEKSKHDEAGDRYSRKRWDYKSPDIKGMLWKKINFNDTYTEYRYFPDGNLKSTTDPENRLTEYSYDALNRLKTVTQTHITPRDTITSYSYDGYGNLGSVTDAEGHLTAYTYDDMRRVVISTSADTGISTYAFDEAGNLIQKTDANGVTIQYEYDALNRLTAINYPSDVDITYSYDEGANGMGRRTGMTDASGSTVFAYDHRGRLVEKNSTLNDYPPVSYRLARTFTPASRVDLITYPSGRTVDFIRYSSSGKIEKILTTHNRMTRTLVSNLDYIPFGGTKSMNTGPAQSVDNQISECGCLESANPGAPMQQSYTHYNDGNLHTLRGPHRPWCNHEYIYDNLARLRHAAICDDTIIYEYDRVGNRLLRKVNGQTETYSYYPGTNRLQGITGAVTVNYTYDNNGNPIGIGNQTYVYNQNNRLTEIIQGGETFSKYTYNGLGQRTIKETGSLITVFHYDFNGNIIAESNPNGDQKAEYIYRGNNRIAYADAYGNIYYYLNNHLGTPLLMTDSGKTVVWEADYRPFGQAKINPMSWVKNNFRFPGQYYDKGTGLHYNYHRYYDPSTGRYLTPDPSFSVQSRGNGIPYLTPYLFYNPQDLHLYSYASANPINSIDPMGLGPGCEVGCVLLGTGRIVFDVHATTTFNALTSWVSSKIPMSTGMNVTGTAALLGLAGGRTFIGAKKWAHRLSDPIVDCIDRCREKDYHVYLRSLPDVFWGTGIECIDY